MVKGQKPITSYPSTPHRFPQANLKIESKVSSQILASQQRYHIVSAMFSLK